VADGFGSFLEIAKRVGDASDEYPNSNDGENDADGAEAE